MANHKKRYLKHIGAGEQDTIICESCRRSRAVDVHHIEPKGIGGRAGADELSNLIGLCRRCHNMAHESLIAAERLLAIAQRRIAKLAEHPTSF